MGLFARAIALALFVLLVRPSGADAQSGGNRVSGSDLRRLRTETLKELPAPEGVPPALRPYTIVPPGQAFTLTFTNGFTYNTNPNQQRHASGADWHESPDLELDVQKQLPADFQLSASLDVNTDRYLRTVSANNDEVWGRLKLAYTGGEWVPYVANTLTLDFVPTFAQQWMRSNDVFAGVARTFQFDAARTPVANVSADSAIVDLSAGRRQAHIAPGTTIAAGTGTFLRFKGGYAHRLSDTLSLGLSPAVEATFRDSQVGSPARRDVLLLGIAALEWTPPWLNVGGLRNGEIDLTIQGAANRSTSPVAQFQQADIGPFLSFFWTF